MHRELDIKFVPLVTVPQSLTHMEDFTVQLGSYCRTLKLVEEDKILVGCSSSLGVYDLALKTITNSFSCNSNIQSVEFNTEHSQVFYLQRNQKVCRDIESFTNRSELFTSPNLGLSRLSVTENYVAVCYSKGNQILIYNSTTKEQRRYSLSGHEGGQIRSI